jgi:hypothetical protein
MALSLTKVPLSFRRRLDGRQAHVDSDSDRAFVRIAHGSYSGFEVSFSPYTRPHTSGLRKQQHAIERSLLVVFLPTRALDHV